MAALLKKYRELILYVLFGAGTVAVDVGLYALLVDRTGIRWANGLGWCGAVAFAFFTNKFFVFRTGGRGPARALREGAEFLGARLASLLVQVWGVDFLVRHGLDQTVLGVTGGLSKALVTVVVIVMNYVLSKFLIFRTPSKEGPP